VKPSKPITLEAAALAWWRGHRPSDWTEAQHLANPTVNAGRTDSDYQLALAVAAWVAARKPKRKAGRL
jgi:hypothetical protein